MEKCWNDSDNNMDLEYMCLVLWIPDELRDIQPSNADEEEF
jgi:hypothetical protein